MPTPLELDALDMIRQILIPQEAYDPDIHPRVGVATERHVHVDTERGNQQEGAALCPKVDYVHNIGKYSVVAFVSVRGTTFDFCRGMKQD